MSRERVLFKVKSRDSAYKYIRYNERKCRSCGCLQEHLKCPDNLVNWDRGVAKGTRTENKQMRVCLDVLDRAGHGI